MASGLEVRKARLTALQKVEAQLQELQQREQRELREDMEQRGDAHRRPPRPTPRAANLDQMYHEAIGGPALSHSGPSGFQQYPVSQPKRQQRNTIAVCAFSVPFRFAYAINFDILWKMQFLLTYTSSPGPGGSIL